jgi:hypothetical protein
VQVVQVNHNLQDLQDLQDLRDLQDLQDLSTFQPFNLSTFQPSFIPIEYCQSNYYFYDQFFTNKINLL